VAYVPRIVDGELTTRLNASGAVVIEGPKACGKTETLARDYDDLVPLARLREGVWFEDEDQAAGSFRRGIPAS
jgi:hypothetical protein